MDLHEIVRYCESKPAVTEDFPFDMDTLTMKVGGKMFLLADVNSDPPRINLKCDPVLAEVLRKEYSAITPGYHMNKVHWNTVTIDGSIPREKVLWMIDHSYELVIRNLPRSIREEIPLG